MKKLFYFLILSVCVLFSCSKEEEIKENPMVGTWKRYAFVKQDGFVKGVTVEPRATITYYDSYSYKLVTDGEATYGKYDYEDGRICFDGGFWKNVEFNANRSVYDISPSDLYGGGYYVSERWEKQ